MNIDDKICYIAKNEYSFFLDKANVIGVGLGKKVCKGVNTSISCIKVFVTKKIASIMLRECDKIPAMYNGIPTDVMATGKIQAAMLTDRIRPVTGGYCIGPAFFKDISGTYGCLVRDANNVYVLSCNHIIAAENEAPLGVPILQPSIRYGGRASSDTIARLSKFIELKFITPQEQPENQVDCAIAKVSNLSLVSKTITYLGDLRGTVRPFFGATVEKVGFKTERTQGLVVATNLTAKLDYGPGKILLFTNLVVTTAMADNGDSGSILVYDHRAMAMTIAVSDNVTVYNPMTDILSALNVSLVL